MRKINVIFDATIVASGYHSGIYFVARQAMLAIIDNPIFRVYFAFDFKRVSSDAIGRFRQEVAALRPRRMPAFQIPAVEQTRFVDFYEWISDVICSACGKSVLRQVAVLPLRFVRKMCYLALSRRWVLDEKSFVADVWFSPVFAPDPSFQHVLRKHEVVILYDTIPLDFKELHEIEWKNPTWWYARMFNSINSNGHYFAISRFTKTSFLKYCPQLSSRQIDVAPLAADERKFYPCHDSDRVSAVLEKYGIPKNCRYVFSLATLEERKNLLLAVESFLEFVRENSIKDLYLVLGGGLYSKCDPRQQKVQDAITAYAAECPMVKLIGYVDDEDLAPLYSRAEIFIYPSLFEGFGLPVLEAMQCGTAVITSKTSSIPEVAGNAALLVDPRNRNDINSALWRLYSDDAFRQDLAARGLVRARQFSWTKFNHIISRGIMAVARSRAKMGRLVVPAAKPVMIYNATILAEGFHSGLYNAAKNILLEFINKGNFSIKLWYFPSIGQDKINALLSDLPFLTKLDYLAESDQRPKEEREEFYNSCDVFFDPLFAAREPFLSRDNILRYTCLYDTTPHSLAHLFLPEKRHSGWYAQCLDSFKGQRIHYFSISHSTKRDFLRFAPGAKPEMIDVSLLAADRSVFSPAKDGIRLSALKAKYGISEDGRFVFSLCSLEVHKNLMRTVEAFLALTQKGSEFENLYLVLGGGLAIGNSDTKEKLEEARKLSDRIVITGYLPEDELPIFYSGAECFVFNSLYEGFGLPLLEAMQCGCPVVANRRSSLPEVCGEAAVYVDPDSAEQLTGALAWICGSAEVRSNLSEASLAQSRNFSWERTVATMTARILDDVRHLPPRETSARTKAVSDDGLPFLKSMKGCVGIDKSKLDAWMSEHPPKTLRPRLVGRRLIVSMTSFPQRCHDIHYALYSIFTQSRLPDKVVLWLGEDKFPGRERDLPATLLKYVEYGLEIRWDKDYHAFTKYVHAAKAFPDDVICTVDDDIFYQPEWLDRLYGDYLAAGAPAVPFASRPHLVKTSASSGVLPYADWLKENGERGVSYRNFITGVGGMLYPPHCMDPDGVDLDKAMRVTPRNDDVWFYFMTLRAHHGIAYSENSAHRLIFVNLERELRISGEVTLAMQNVVGGSNDVYVANVLKEYPYLLNLIYEGIPGFVPVKNVGNRISLRLRDAVRAMRRFRQWPEAWLQCVRDLQEVVSIVRRHATTLESARAEISVLSEKFRLLAADSKMMLEQHVALQREVEAVRHELSQGHAVIRARIAGVKGEVNVLAANSASRESLLIDEMVVKAISDAEARAFHARINSDASASEDIIPIAFVTDAKYLMPALVSASSILRHASHPERIRVYILHADINPQLIARVSVFSRQISFMRIDKDYTELAGKHLWVSSAAMIKFDLAELFPQYRKMLYLDADTIVCSDIDELFSQDIGGYYGAAVKDIAGTLLEHHNDKMGHEHYFNSGMMLFDLDKLRADDMPRKLVKAKRNDKWHHFMDQDAFNEVLGTGMKYLNPKFNMMLFNLVKMDLPISAVAKFYGVSIPELIAAENSPVVQHFSNIDKPWLSLSSMDYGSWHLEREYVARALKLADEQR